MNGRIEHDALGPESYAGHRGRDDRKRVQAHVDGAEQRRLDQLQIALVAGGKLRDDPEHLAQRRLGRRRAAADQLEHVRVALLRHDRRARRERVRQLDERELLRVEQQQVGSEPAGVLHRECDLEQELRFGGHLGAGHPRARGERDGERE